MKFGANYNYKRNIKLSSPDKESYTGVDSGCSEATLWLGYQSHCLTNCPFEKCKEEDKKERNLRRYNE